MGDLEHQGRHQAGITTGPGGGMRTVVGPGELLSRSADAIAVATVRR
jgi:hypothetical protein